MNITNLPSGLSVHRSIISQAKINELLQKANILKEELEIKDVSCSILYPLGVILNLSQVIEKPYIKTPHWLENLGQELFELQLCPLPPNQYRIGMFKNRGVAWHIDSKFFGDFLCTLSLSNNRTIEFRKNDKQYQLKLSAGDIYIQQGELRNEWEHQVLQPGGCSVTFSRINIDELLEVNKQKDTEFLNNYELKIQRKRFTEGGFKFTEISKYWK